MPYRKKKVSFGEAAKSFAGREGLVILIFAILALVVMALIFRPSSVSEIKQPSYESLDEEKKQRIKDYFFKD